MLTLTLIVIGFLAATALVIVLARSSTARWEREKRAPVAPRYDHVRAGPGPSAGAARRAREAVRTMVTVVRDHGTVPVAVRAVAGRLVTTVREVGSRVRSSGVRPTSLLRGWLRRVRAVRGGPAGPLPVDTAEGTSGAPVPRLPLPRRSGGRRAGAAGRRSFRRTSRRPHRRLREFFHRHDAVEDPQVRPVDSDQGPAAG